MFGGSTQASTLQQHGLLTSTQPAIGKDGSRRMDSAANESTFFYNSDDDDREVEEIL